MNKFRRIAAICIVSLLLVACSGGSSPESEAGSSTSAATASSAFPFMGVAELDTFLAENAGKPTMLLFWTTWCPSCKQEIPEMEQLHASDGDKMNIITVSLDEKVEALQDYFKDKKTGLPVYHGDNALARKFGVEAIPTLVIFDKDGKQVFAKAGVFPHSMLQGMVEKLTK